jgi:hypothetical protein
MTFSLTTALSHDMCTPAVATVEDILDEKGWRGIEHEIEVSVLDVLETMGFEQALWCARITEDWRKEWIEFLQDEVLRCCSEHPVHSSIFELAARLDDDDWDEMRRLIPVVPVWVRTPQQSPAEYYIWLYMMKSNVLETIDRIIPQLCHLHAQKSLGVRTDGDSETYWSFHEEKREQIKTRFKNVCACN